ncbi:MAG: choice-of-anchor D domain-containing protein [Acidobacteriia bacterium]|nr:choice-of-anchor D domain-containing protein [Terriglobia bacterium]
MKLPGKLAITSTILFALLAAAGAQTWTPLVNQPGVNVGVMLQLRDGRILVHEEQAGNSRAWHILTPDSTGSYVNGTWSSGGNMPTGYAPWFFGSQVLMDGKTVVIEGGEYNSGQSVWTTKGAIGTISGSTITWTSNSPPAGWTNLGDAESVILANGTYMQSNCCTAQNALFNGPNSWTATGSVNQSSNDESGFTLLSNDQVLTVDAKHSSNCGTNQGSELYDQGTGIWSCGPNLPVQLYNANDEELGAAVLMYNNKVFQFGGNVVATAIYDVASNTWSSGPTPGNGLDQADGPAALEPNGKVLAMLSPGLFQGGCQFVEYDPTTNTLTNTANPSNCPSDSSYVGHLMILPTGQIMFTDFSGTVEIYTPAAGVVGGVAPTINALSGSVGSPSTNTVLSGAQLNGLSEANAYGDDYQGATNYPLVRLVPAAAPNTVYYATTHDESTHSIAPSTSNSTKFDVPAGLPSGSYNLYVVANGIESNPVVVDVVPGAGFSLGASPSSVGIVQGSSGASTITVTPQSGFSGSVTLSVSGLPSGVTAAFSPNPTTTTSTLTLTASATATTGTSTLTITGVSGSVTATTALALTVNPSGTGPTVTVSPTSLTWGTVVLGATGAAKAVTLTNTGSVALSISSITSSGDFALAASSKPCGSTLAAGKSCIIKVTFTPTAVGTRTGTLTLTDNSPSSPQTVALSGTGGVQAKLTPVTATFPKELVGVSSPAKVFTLKNLQAVSLTGISVSTTGDFSVSTTTCSTSLAAKSTCTISVVFTPTQTGTRTGTLQVSDSAAGSPQISTLTGTGK